MTRRQPGAMLATLPMRPSRMRPCRVSPVSLSGRLTNRARRISGYRGRTWPRPNCPCCHGPCAPRSSGLGWSRIGEATKLSTVTCTKFSFASMGLAVTGVAARSGKPTMAAISADRKAGRRQGTSTLASELPLTNRFVVARSGSRGCQNCGSEIQPNPSTSPAITARAREADRTQNMARGPVPWRASVGVSLVAIRSVLSHEGIAWIKRTNGRFVPRRGQAG